MTPEFVAPRPEWSSPPRRKRERRAEKGALKTRQKTKNKEESAKMELPPDPFGFLGFFFGAGAVYFGLCRIEERIIFSILNFFVVGSVHENILPLEQAVFSVPVETLQKPHLFGDFTHRIDIR